MFTAAFIAGLELLVFGSESCLPCKAMLPVIAQLESEGVKVFRIDVDKQESVADAWKVTAVPTVIVTQNRREVKRFVGLTSYADIRAAMQPAALPAPPAQPAPSAPQPVPPAPVQPQRLTDNQIIERALACHVRVRAENASSTNWGSGCVFYYGDRTGIGRSDILTNRHVVSGGSTRLSVDDGTAYYSRAACVEVWPRLEVAIGDDVAVLVVDQLAPASLPLCDLGYEPISPVYFVGNPKGGNPVPRKANIVKRWTTPDGRNMMSLDAPAVEGDSGAGLLDSRGYLIGLITYYDEDGNAWAVDLTRSPSVGPATRAKSQQKAKP